MDNDNKKNTDSIVLTSVFYNKPLYLYIFKKVTKIGSALYLITDLIKDSEPLKWSLRKEALEAMSFIASFKDIAMSSREILSHLSSVRSLLEVGRISKIISEMNAALLEREIQEIFELLRRENDIGASFSKDFFFVESVLPETLPSFSSTRFAAPSQARPSYKGHFQGQNNNDFYKNSTGGGEKKYDIGQKEDKQKIKGQRRDEILKVIKSKPNLTIKDITSVIKDVSEKTIQRELIVLLSEGVIKRTGERRWSRYFLA